MDVPRGRRVDPGISLPRRGAPRRSVHPALLARVPDHLPLPLCAVRARRREPPRRDARSVPHRGGWEGAREGRPRDPARRRWRPAPDRGPTGIAGSGLHDVASGDLTPYTSSPRMKKAALSLLLLLLCLAAAPRETATAPVAAPAPGVALEPPASGGLVALDRLLQRLSVHKRMLVIGAHPDDEDNRLLTVVSRKMGAEVAYLSLARGEGGQNLIGSDLGIP